MDHVLAGSLTAVRDFDIPDPELWFTLISEVYQELADSDWGPDFIDFRARFTDRASMEGLREAAEEFVRYAEDNGGIELVRQAHEEGVANLAYEFDQLVGAAATSDAQRDSLGYSYDEDAWATFLPEVGAQWNGQEDAWEPWVDWFVYHAQDRGLVAPAMAFVEYAAAQPDKVAVFAAYGIDIEVPSPDAAYDDDPYADVDTDAWMAFLTHVGSDWNGDEDTWPQFVDWFTYHAEVQGLASVAAGFIQYAEGEPDKIAFFARYGIEIAAADADPVAVAQQRVEAVVAGSGSIAEEHVPLLAGAVAELFTAVPAAALLSEEQLRQLLEEIVEEHL